MVVGVDVGSWEEPVPVEAAQEVGSTQVPGQPLSARFGLLERDAELAAVEGLIAAAQAGLHLLALEGPPGIGKTALIAQTKALGQAAGMQVLGGRGSELERSFSYGVVRQLFEPLLASLPAEERAELLSGAAGLAAPLFDPARLAAEPAADSSLATLHGLYWLAANLADRGRLLLAVDDLHWCDLLSLRWLAYLLPRMEGLDVWVVVGLRPGEPGEDPGLLGQIVSDPLATIVSPAALSSAAAARLLRETLPDADDAFCAACHEETGGNPLLLRELVHTIVADGLTPTEEHLPRLRELGARAGSRTVAVRLARLPPEATRLARAVAILGDDAEPRQAAALADLDDEAASEAAVALARVDILRPQPPFGFVHPLIRAAVYDALTPAERDSGHARAARLLEAAGAEPERVAAHLLLAPRSGDPGAVAVLRQAARRAGSRGAAESAVAYLRRALAEPPPAAERAELLLELGSVEALVSGDAAIEHLQQAHELLDDPIRRAEAALLLGHQLLLFSRRDEADAVFTHALDELAGADSELERRLEAALISNAMTEPSLYHQAVERLERLRNRPGDTTLGDKALLALLAYHDARAGAPAAVAVPVARRALSGGVLIKGAKAAALFVGPAIVLALADLDEAVVAYDDATRGGPSVRFDLHLRRGQGLPRAGLRVARRAGRGRSRLPRGVRRHRDVGDVVAPLGVPGCFPRRLPDGAGQARGGRGRAGPRRIRPRHAHRSSLRQAGAPSLAARRPGRRRRGAARGGSPVRVHRRPQSRSPGLALAGCARAPAVG